MNPFVSQWTHRKLYTLMLIIYEQNEVDDAPRVLKDGKYTIQQGISQTGGQSWLLLGLKQRGFGKGRWNAFGGKVQSDDSSPRAAAVRELKEESGLDVSEKSIDEVGRLWFTFTETYECMEVHVFICREWKPLAVDDGHKQWPCDTEEMHPSWFPIGSLAKVDGKISGLDVSKVPYDHMWPDDRLWLPQVLTGNHLLGWLHLTRMTQSILPHEDNLLADCITDTNGLEIDPYQITTYRVEFFTRAISEEDSTIEQDKCDFLQRIVSQFRLESDQMLREWMGSKVKHSSLSSELHLFG
ncbi:7 8-dihydro-8-oxoguanine triphosphatase [Paragonimus heterotremus]|uniref:7 8-dihydro-8-oxoguanine triphosphatase n=1 Tax=Paragonimus heterotremus TaxID=100268 RepID=A0A8J4X3C9_9TREM|nr:7 8-dihydro-8-oxoguanine triphosphatase [Paragonimus heterotremus]